MATRPTVLSLTADLATGRITSRALVEVALARITDPSGALRFFKTAGRPRTLLGRMIGNRTRDIIPRSGAWWHGSETGRQGRAD